MFRSSRLPDDLPRRISNVDAAIAMALIPHLDSDVRARCVNKRRLDETLEYLKRSLNLPIETLALPLEGWKESCTKHIFLYDFSAVPHTDASMFYDFFSQAGIELQPLYALLHLEPGLNDRNRRLPDSEKLAYSALNLPTDPTLDNRDIVHIRRTLSSFFDQCKRGSLAA
jgi:dTDP-4-amino-4,6-dideoxygalactose transaminase